MSNQTSKRTREQELEDVLREVAELIEGYVDVTDGDYGMPAPNKAMRARMLIKEILEGY